MKFTVDFHKVCAVRFAQNSTVPPVSPSQVVWSPSDTKIACDEVPLQLGTPSPLRTNPSREGRRQLRGGRPQGRCSRCSGHEFKASEAHLGTVSTPRPPSMSSGRESFEIHTQVDGNGTRESPVTPLYRISWRPMAKVFVCHGSPLPECLES